MRSLIIAVTTFFVSLYVAHANTVANGYVVLPTVPLYIDDSAYIDYEVKMDSALIDIERVCIHMQFNEADSLDETETISVRGTHPTGQFWYSHRPAHAPYPNMEIEQCFFSQPSSTFHDWFGEDQNLTFRVLGSVLIDSIDVRVEGMVSPYGPHYIDLNLDAGQTGVIPASGGKLKYEAHVTNEDVETPFHLYSRWSIVTMPDGTPISWDKPNQFKVNAGDTKSFLTVNYVMKDYLPAGQYTLTWYLMAITDPGLPIRQSQLMFTKE